MNKLFIILLSLVIFLQYNLNQLPPSPKSTPVKYLQSISVTIKKGFTQGSGVIQKIGKDVYVWTANHVLESKITPDAPLEVVQYIYYKGKISSIMYFRASVFARSDKYDLALLKLEHNNFFKNSARLYNEDEPPALGEEVWHIGSPYGEANHNSTFKGIYSQYDRQVKDKFVDQVHTGFAPGGSGGGIFLNDGRLVGLAVMMRDPNVGFIVPSRDMIKWVKTTKLPRELLR